MGRTKREMPVGRLRLKYPSKDYDLNKEYTLYYEYSINGAVIRKDTGIRVRVKDWNENGNARKGELRPGYGAEYKRINSLIIAGLSKYDSLIAEYVSKHPGELNKTIVHSILFDEPITRDDQGQDFVDYVKMDLQYRLNANKIKYSRYENGLSSMNIFQEFLRSQQRGTYKEDSIYLGEITGDLLDEFIDYRKRIKNNSNATINHSLTPIIIACSRARDNGFITDKQYASIKDKRLVEDGISIDDTGFDGKYLTKSDLKKLVAFYESDKEIRRREYVEMFLFAFHAGGMRIVDVMTLQWANVDFNKMEIKKALVKTVKNQKQRHVIPMTEPVARILRKWQKMGRTKKFVFDLLPSDDFDITDASALYRARNSVDRKVNQALKVVGFAIGLPFSLTFHAARHSFAINALNDEKHPLDMYQVSRLLGHSSTEVTEKVYAEFVSYTLQDKMKALNFNFIPNLGE